MKISSISDLHIIDSQDSSYQLLLSFMENPEVKDSSEIYFLGDIFDFMMGGHLGYLEAFPEFFRALKGFLGAGKEVHFFEGNHDFHLEALFKKHLNSPRFYYHRKGFFKNLHGKKIFFCHGDDLQTRNLSYFALKSILRNPFSGLLFNHIFPFKAQNAVAAYFSGKSRKRNERIYFAQEKVRDIFRTYVLEFWEKNPCEVVVAGHSHVLDDFETVHGKRYLNNGHPGSSKNFVVIDGQGPRLKEIS
jgi:UDP-2,3-diacylglucosamine hydrolase